jgi:uncharacterized membrane protein YphA (DoxX/SURF4 family)
MNISKYYPALKGYAPVVIRIGMALVFLWFSINQFMDPKPWIGFLPGFLASMSNPVMFVYANATFEAVFGILLLLGIWTRWSALLLALHLVGITISVGYTSVGVRDFGLTFATFCIAFYGTDKLCLEKIWKKE